MSKRFGFNRKQQAVSPPSSVSNPPLEPVPAIAETLIVEGPSIQRAGSCAQFTVRSLDGNGKPAVTLSEVIDISGLDAGDIYIDAQCTRRSSELEMRNEAQFHIKSTVAQGRSFDIKVRNSSLRGAFQFDVVAASAERLIVETPLTMAGNECIEGQIKITDALSNPVGSTSELQVGLSATGTGGIFADALCEQPATSVQIVRGNPVRKVWIFATSAGELKIQARSEELGSSEQTIRVLSTEVPRLAVLGNQSVAGQCALYRVETLYNNAPFKVRAETTINLSSDSSLANFYSDAECLSKLDGKLLRFSMLSQSSNFYISQTVSGPLTVTANATNFVSGSATHPWIAAAANSLQLIHRTSPLPAGACSGPLQVILRDAFGNKAIEVSGGDIEIIAGGTSASFFTNSTCSSIAVTKVSIPNGASETAFYFKAANSGELSVSLRKASLLEATARFSVTTGTPFQIQIAVPLSITAGQCQRFELKSLDSLANPLDISPHDLIFSLSATSGSLFGDERCSLDAITTLTLAQGSNKREFYFNSTASGASIVSVTQSELKLSASVGIFVIAEAPAQLDFLIRPATAVQHQCSALNLVAKDRFGNLATFTKDIVVSLESVGTLFYRDAACTESVTAPRS